MDQFQLYPWATTSTTLKQQPMRSTKRENRLQHFKSRDTFGSVASWVLGPGSWSVLGCGPWSVLRFFCGRVCSAREARFVNRSKWQLMNLSPDAVIAHVRDARSRPPCWENESEKVREASTGRERTCVMLWPTLGQKMTCDAVVHLGPEDDTYGDSLFVKRKRPISLCFFLSKDSMCDAMSCGSPCIGWKDITCDNGAQPGSKDDLCDDVLYLGSKGVIAMTPRSAS